jgi:hypothetical protein
MEPPPQRQPEGKAAAVRFVKATLLLLFGSTTICRESTRPTPRNLRWQSAFSMAGESKTTTDHDEIRAGRRRAVVGRQTYTEKGDEEAGILRIRFPFVGHDHNLEDIDWDALFEKFEESRLAFRYQDHTKEGDTSRFF